MSDTSKSGAKRTQHFGTIRRDASGRLIGEVCEREVDYDLSPLPTDIPPTLTGNSARHLWGRLMDAYPDSLGLATETT